MMARVEEEGKGLSRISRRCFGMNAEMAEMADKVGHCQQRY
jgi:hypothetical protein